MLPGITPIIAGGAPELTVIVVPESQIWQPAGPARWEATSTAIASGGMAPYSYHWNDDGPTPIDGNYFGASKGWYTNFLSESFVAVTVTDALGQTAFATAIIYDG